MSGARNPLGWPSDVTRRRIRSVPGAPPFGRPAMEGAVEDPDLRARDLPSRYPPTAPTAAPTTALVQTFRSLLIASSKALNPAHRPTPNPAPAPPIVQATVARPLVVDWV